MHRPALVARGSVRHVFASTSALVLSTLGFVVLGVGAVVGPVGAVLGVTIGTALAWQWRRLRRLRLVVDVDALEPVLRHGRDGSASLPLADVAGGIVHRTAGTTYRGIRTGADVERWLVVGHDGRLLLQLDGRGFAAGDLAAARARIGGVWMSAAAARHDGAMPPDAPWHMRHPVGAAAVAVGAGIATAVVLVGGLVALTRIGTAAFVWPWWS